MKSTRNDTQFWIPAFAGMTEGYALARYGTRETGAMSIIAEITIKREGKGANRAALNATLPLILEALVNDKPLEARYCDHALTGNWKGYRECHIKPDLLLIYAKPDAQTLLLERLGSHSQLNLA
jgi:mRNA interferase YafQ